MKSALSFIGFSRSSLLAVLTLAVSAPGFAADLESIPANEPAATEKIVRLVREMVRDQVARDGQPGTRATRDAHAKSHGCVKASVQVLGGLAPELAQGVFSEPRTFPAWIRFSNGSGRSQDDAVGDGRGMAIKLMGVEGSESTTQDFVMIHHPTFFVRNVLDYVELQQGLNTGHVRSFFFPGANPLRWRLREFSIATAIQRHSIQSPLDSRYFSMTPYLLGERAVKFSVRPCGTDVIPKLPRVGPHFLRENMRTELSASFNPAGRCFALGIQLRLEGAEAAMPIEDPTVEWSETRSPFLQVARVEIPTQDFDSPAQNEFCENLSFTPWHTLPVHRPLGGINRVRKVVYEEISRLRHELNGTQRREPAP